MKNYRIVIACVSLLILGLVLKWLARSREPVQAPLTPITSSADTSPVSNAPQEKKNIIPGRHEAVVTTNSDTRIAGLTRDFIENMKTDPLYQFKRPIDFYGKVVDENDRPVQNAAISFQWNKLSTNGEMETGEAATSSDGDGLFSLNGQKSNGLNVKVSKAGYYTVGGASISFEYAQPYMPNFHTPDPQNPVIFHLRKHGVGEPLVGDERLFGFSPDGTQYYLDLLAGKKSTDSSADWDISVKFMKSKPNEDKKFDWSLLLESSGGGFIQTNGEFLFTAPETGYGPIQITMNAADPSWQPSTNFEAFVKSRDGKIYSRVRVEVFPDYNQKAAINLKYSVNPSGSRNLEAAANNQ
jgi:hypothetical protein